MMVGRSDQIERLAGLVERARDLALRAFQADLFHRLAEGLAVLRNLDRRPRGTDQRHAVLRERAVVGERQRGVERGLPAHGRQQRVRLLGGDDPPHDLGRDRLDVGGVGELGVGHDRRRVRVHQDHPVALVLERLAGLRARIVELAGLADHDGAGPDHHDRADVGALRHRAGSAVSPSARRSGRRDAGHPAGRATLPGGTGPRRSACRRRRGLPASRRRGRRAWR